MTHYYVSLALSCCGKQGEKSLTSAPSPHFFFFFWLALLTSSPSPPSLRPPRTCSPSFSSGLLSSLLLLLLLLCVLLELALLLFLASCFRAALLRLVGRLVCLLRHLPRGVLELLGHCLDLLSIVS